MLSGEFKCFLSPSWLLNVCLYKAAGRSAGVNYSVKMVFVLSAKENMVPQWGKKRFDENHLINRVHVPLVLELHWGKFMLRKL